jgi:hypothetical protein
MPRKKKQPKAQQMGFSGIHEDDLDAFVADLKKAGATDIEVSPDEDTSDEYEGVYYIVDYKR